MISGYTGGDVENPSYRQVTSGRTGHFEAVEVRYDPETVSYAELLAVYWRNVDATDDGGQFCDRGPSYRGAIFPSMRRSEAPPRHRRRRWRPMPTPLRPSSRRFSTPRPSSRPRTITRTTTARTRSAMATTRQPAAESGASRRSGVTTGRAPRQAPEASAATAIALSILPRFDRSHGPTSHARASASFLNTSTGTMSDAR